VSARNRLPPVDRQDLDRLLGLLGQWDASDLHLKAGTMPRVRIDGQLRQVPDEEKLGQSDTYALARAIMPAEIASLFERRHEADFAYSIPGVGRFRVNAYYQRGSVALAFRRVRSVPGSVEELFLPQAVLKLADEPRGLILVTGPTGSGKTTTLAAMIDHINKTRPCHIITIEDPIEYLHSDVLASIGQREVGFDTDSFATAMRVVLRQDPDVILVGEMRDLETASAALTAAETGHLVLSTLHTIDATETIARIVDFFPPHQQNQIRASLAGSLKGTVAQRLVRRADGGGRLPAVEVMLTNGRIRECIEDRNKTSDIAEIIAGGAYYGMQSFDQSLALHLEAGQITLDEAMSSATNAHDLRVSLERRGLVKTGQG
jgi:twitching motility protein PilT